MEIAKKRVAARGKHKVSSRNGSKSTARYHLERGEDLDSSSGQLETWRLTHFDEEKGWISNDVEALYKEMMKLRKEHTEESVSDKLILEKVLGRKFVRLNGWGRDPATSHTNGTTNKSKRPSCDELVDQLETLKGMCATMKQVLIDNNIMRQPSTPGASQVNASEFDEESEYDEDIQV